MANGLNTNGVKKKNIIEQRSTVEQPGQLETQSRQTVGQLAQLDSPFAQRQQTRLSGALSRAAESGQRGLQGQVAQGAFGGPKSTLATAATRELTADQLSARGGALAQQQAQQQQTALQASAQGLLQSRSDVQSGLIKSTQDLQREQLQDQQVQAQLNSLDQAISNATSVGDIETANRLRQERDQIAQGAGREQLGEIAQGPSDIQSTIDGIGQLEEAIATGTFNGESLSPGQIQALQGTLDTFQNLFDLADSEPDAVGNTTSGAEWSVEGGSVSLTFPDGSVADFDLDVDFRDKDGKAFDANKIQSTLSSDERFSATYTLDEVGDLALDIKKAMNQLGKTGTGPSGADVAFDSPGFVFDENQTALSDQTVNEHDKSLITTLSSDGSLADPEIFNTLNAAQRRFARENGLDLDFQVGQLIGDATGESNALNGFNTGLSIEEYRTMDDDIKQAYVAKLRENEMEVTGVTGINNTFGAGATVMVDVIDEPLRTLGGQKEKGETIRFNQLSGTVVQGADTGTIYWVGPKDNGDIFIWDGNKWNAVNDDVKGTPDPLTPAIINTLEQ